jgi:hypothetical protein
MPKVWTVTLVLAATASWSACAGEVKANERPSEMSGLLTGQSKPEAAPLLPAVSLPASTSTHFAIAELGVAAKPEPGALLAFSSDVPIVASVSSVDAALTSSDTQRLAGAALSLAPVRVSASLSLDLTADKASDRFDGFLTTRPPELGR